MWRAHDPYELARRLRGIPLYLSVGDGTAGPFDPPGRTDGTERLLNPMNVALAARLRRLGHPGHGPTSTARERTRGRTGSAACTGRCRCCCGRCAESAAAQRPRRSSPRNALGDAGERAREAALAPSERRPRRPARRAPRRRALLGVGRLLRRARRRAAAPPGRLALRPGRRPQRAVARRRHGLGPLGRGRPASQAAPVGGAGGGGAEARRAAAPRRPRAEAAAPRPAAAGRAEAASAAAARPAAEAAAPAPARLRPADGGSGAGGSAARSGERRGWLGRAAAGAGGSAAGGSAARSGDGAGGSDGGGSDGGRLRARRLDGGGSGGGSGAGGSWDAAGAGSAGGTGGAAWGSIGGDGGQWLGRRPGGGHIVAASPPAPGPASGGRGQARPQGGDGGAREGRDRLLDVGRLGQAAAELDVELEVHGRRAALLADREGGRHLRRPVALVVVAADRHDGAAGRVVALGRRR